MNFWLRVSKVKVGIILAVLLGALFVDCFALIYRLAVHQWYPKNLTSTPNIGGYPIALHKGLDIQGGAEITIQVCAGYNNPAGTTPPCRNGPPSGVSVSDARDRTVPLIQQRVNGLGVSEAKVAAQGSDQILVQIPGVGIDEAVKTIGTTAKLHFATAVPGDPNPGDPAFLRDQQNLYDPKQFGDGLDYFSGYHWKIDDNLQATDVESAQVGTDQNGNPSVDISFNSAGADEWQKITTAAYDVYQKQGQSAPQAHVAIFLDNEVISAPYVESPSSNNTQISGSFTPAAAQQLASFVNEGALPAEITTVQKSEVSATLGQDTITKSLIAGGVGLLIIVLFMLGYYRWAGLLACIALAGYGAIALAIYKLAQVTLSLAGLAGFVLSVGMAVDANVLIFERMRDELRHGKSVGAAVDTGFRRAYPAIRDSNISTGIACVILYIFGTDVVKGFALTLGLGVMVSFFSAVLVTRALFHWAVRMQFFRRVGRYVKLRSAEEAPSQRRFDIVKARNLYFLGSLAVIIPGIIAIIALGFRLGLDFQGGYKLDVALSHPATVADVTAIVNSAAPGREPLIQAEQNNRFSIQFLATNGTTDPVATIDSQLDKKYGIAKDAKGQPDAQEQFIGPSVASGLVTQAIVLVLVASLLIALYLGFWAFRKQRGISSWRFAACTFLKLLHDVFVLAGIWAILGHFTSLGEINILFVVALLTSVAFSIHDTIVVFDRVRENLRFGPRLTFDQVVNLSTIQTMTRSLNTSLTVVFVLLALVLFGGDTIRGFVLALLVGIGTGTYSSIFNASTLLVAWQKLRGTATPPSGRSAQRVQRAA